MIVKENGWRKYIHYGHRKFDREKFVPIKNQSSVKPIGGLWCCRCGQKQTWKNWNEHSNFAKCEEKNSFTFSIAKDTKVLVINSSEELASCGFIKTLEHGIITLDFERILSKGIGALEVNISRDQNLYWDLYGWDCDSVLILDPDCIK